MDLKNNNNDSKEKEEHKDLLKIPLNLENEKYLLKIFPSKDNISIILKLEIETKRTYYYYGKFYLNDLKKINTKFNTEKNINNIFVLLKEITQSNICKLEKQQLKMNILFINKNSEIISIFTLRKKIIEQNRLNFQLNEEIQENKAKIKNLKKEIAKLDKIIKTKNDIIDNINNNIIKITNVVNNININVNNNLDNCKNNDMNYINDINSINNKKINKNIYKINEKQNILKENFYLKKDYKKTTNEIGKKKYEVNVFPKDKKSIKVQSTLFNLEILKNRKIFEALIIFNIIAGIIVIYLLYYINDLQSYLMLRMEDQGLLKKIALLNLLENNKDDDNNGLRDNIRDNIIDFQLQNNNDVIYKEEQSNSKKKLTFIIRKKKNLLSNEREKRYFRKHIKRKIRSRVHDIDFELIYNSHDSYKYIDSYKDSKNIQEILIIMETKEGKRYGLFTNDTILHEKKSYIKGNEYSGYSFNDDKIIEINLKLFFKNYGGYIKSISQFLKNEKLNLEKKLNNASEIIMPDIDLFEIYEVKYIK